MITDAVSPLIVMFCDGCLGGRGFYWTSSNRGDKTWATNRVNELITVFSVSLVFFFFCHLWTRTLVLSVSCVQGPLLLGFLLRQLFIYL